MAFQDINLSKLRTSVLPEKGSVYAYICYSALDSSLAHEIVEKLFSYACYMPARDIPLGSRWSTTIDKAIKEADVFVVIYTNNFNNSSIVVDELYKANYFNKRVITYCVDTTPFRYDKISLKGSYQVPFSAGDHRTLECALKSQISLHSSKTSEHKLVYNYTVGSWYSKDASEKYTFHPHLDRPKGSLFKSLLSRLLNSYEHVNSAIYAPGEVSCGEYMLVQVYIYRAGEEQLVELKAKSIDYDAILRNYEPLHISLKRGDRIKILYNNGFYHEERTIVWQREFCKTDFFFKVTEGYSFYSHVNIFINDLPVGDMVFKTKVIKNPDKTLNAEISCRRYNKIFISYAHTDASKVQYFAEAYKASGTEFFYDRESLSPGDKYQDKIFEYIDSAELFILCWSRNSAASEWCCLEKERALYNARIKDFRIYPVSISPKTSLPSDMSSEYHFGEI